MNDTKFTPGPWTVSPTGTYIRKDGVNGWNIATIEDQPPYTEANRNLIAAAPDIFKALEAGIEDYRAALVAAHEASIEPYDPMKAREQAEKDETLIKMNTALSKAKGGSK